MKNVTIALFVKDRYHHVKLCTKFLQESLEVEGFTFRTLVFDDQSRDPKMEDLFEQWYNPDVIHICHGDLLPDQRIGYARQMAVDVFLHCADCKDSDYLLLLDSDIILTKSTIAEAIQDYDMLSESLNVGGYTLHALRHIRDSFHIEGKLYGIATLTGDAHILFRRDHLEKIGNHFSAKSQGFADNQIKAIYDAGLQYYTRLDPSYQVQHIGFGEDASTMDRDKPFWTMRPYWTQDGSKRVIKVDGFDVIQYVEFANQSGGGLKAPEQYLTINLKNERPN